MDCAEPTQVTQELTIEAETIFKAALTKLGSSEYQIQLKATSDYKHFAILDVQINDYPYTSSQKKTTVYSYFHDTVKDAKEDAYSQAVAWLQAELNLIIDVKANKQLKETQHRLKMSASVAAIMEEKYTETATEAARFRDHKELAMTKMMAAAQEMPGVLNLVENTTPMKPTSAPYPHMVYMGQDPPRNEKEKLAECLCEVYTLLKLA